MVIKYYDGRKDERECVDITGFTLIHAYMVNPDYSLESVLIDDMDYQDGRVGDAKIDASDETCEKVRAKFMIGMSPFKAHERYKGVRAGDVVEVVKGRKYPVGKRITVEKVYLYELPYGRSVDYISGTEGEKIQAGNCKIVEIGRDWDENELGGVE